MKKKIIITTTQLKNILKHHEAKYPMTFIMAGIDKAEMAEIVLLLKSKKKG